jgi:hypothetical protein
MATMVMDTAVRPEGRRGQVLRDARENGTGVRTTKGAEGVALSAIEARRVTIHPPRLAAQPALRSPSPEGRGGPGGEDYAAFGVAPPPTCGSV